MKRLLGVLLAAALAATLLGQVVFASAPQLRDYSPQIFNADEMHPEGPLDTSEASDADGTGAAIMSSSVGTQRYFPAMRYPSGYSLRMFTLRAVGQYGEIWVANSLAFPGGDPRNPRAVVTDEQVAYMLGQFDTNMYPIETEFFGDPVARDGGNALLPYGYQDGSNRVVILVDNIRDESYYNPSYPSYIAGYFSTTVRAYTDRNIITIDCYDWANRVGPDGSPWRDTTRPGRAYLYEGTFAHEFQHLLHRDHDGDEETWINEGQSDFAQYLCGYSDLNTDGHIDEYLLHPYNSLVNWQDQGGLEILADYGSAYLFQLYLCQKYGGAPFIQALHQSQLNGIASVNDTLKQFGYDKTFDDVYRDWQIALLINSDQPGNGLYKFDGLNKRIDLTKIDPLMIGPNGPVYDPEEYAGAKALPWGPAYNAIANKPAKLWDVYLNGVGLLKSPWQVVDDPAGSGAKVLWGNTGSLLDSILVTQLDLTGVTQATLTFDTLYDTEESWDYGFVQISADSGKTWASLSNQDTRSDVDPSGHPTVYANVPGFTGSSDGWKTEAFDLTPYAGKNVFLSFRYVTDWGSEMGGFFIRNVTVPAVGLALDGSSLDGFMSLQEATLDYCDYAIGFVGMKTVGKREYKVFQLDPASFEEQQLDLQQFLRDSSLDAIILIDAYMAPENAAEPLNFSYSVEYHKVAPKK